MAEIPTKKSEDGQILYGLVRTERRHPLVRSFDRVTWDHLGDVFVFDHSDGTTLWYRLADETPLIPAIAVSAQDKENWEQKAPNLREQLAKPQFNWLLEVRERLSPDQLLGTAYHHCHNGPPDIITGFDWWCPITHANSSSLLSNFQEGKKAYLTSDGVELWEIRALRAPLFEGGGWLVEIARERGFNVAGVESVIGTIGLPFVEDEERRKSLQHRVQKIESELQAKMELDVIGDCSEVCEAMLTAIGLQRLAAKLSFGDYKSPENFKDKGALRKMLDAFRAILTEVAPEDAKWLPDVALAMEAMKFWCEWKKHDVKAHRSKLKPDGFTAATCYGALRDFIRICRWVHENHPDVLSPKPRES